MESGITSSFIQSVSVNSLASSAVKTASLELVHPAVFGNIVRFFDLIISRIFSSFLASRLILLIATVIISVCEFSIL